PVLKTLTRTLFCMVCLFAPLSAAEGWNQVISKNFFVIGDAGESDLRRSAARLEQFRETLRNLLPQLKLDGGVRTTVVVFKDAASYAPYKPRRPDGGVDTAVAGYFQHGEGVNYITLSISDKPSAYGTIFHEYIHFLLDTNIGRSDLPPWLNEGLAEYFETLQVLGDGRVLLGTPPAGHLSLLRKNHLIPFKQFLTTDNFALHRIGDDPRSLFYAQAWALTHLLLHRDGPGNVTRTLKQIVSSMSTNADRETVFGNLFGSDLSTAQASLRKYVDQPVLPQHQVPAARPGVSGMTMQASMLSEAQSSAYLGDLLYHTGRLAEAEVSLRKALAVDKESTLANIALGLVLTKKKDFINARKHLEKAVDADRTNHYAYFNLAYAISREYADENGNVTSFPAEASKQMQNALRRAIGIRPEFAESYRLLALVHLVDGTDLDEAADLIRKGLRQRPGDQDFSLLLAQIFLRQEKFAEAKLIAENLATTAVDSNTFNAAQVIVRTVNDYMAATRFDDAGAAKVFGPNPPIILKRSTLTDEDVAAYEEERMIANLNRLIDRPRFAEKLVVGYIDKVGCTGGDIRFAVRTADDTFYLNRSDISGLRMSVLTEGERSFTVDCGVGFAKQLTVLKFEPSVGSKPNIRGRLLSITFVPDYFRIKTPEEMANRRSVIIEDDRVFTSRSKRSTSNTPDPAPR
ncbi:MAG: tetratricopeptide repeat protein, partial [Pyrinomonadaceae bacterium]